MYDRIDKAGYSQQNSEQVNTQITMPQMNCSMTYMPQMVNNQYYNLFVAEQDGFDGLISIPRKYALDDYTDKDIRKIFAKPKLAALNEIKQLPSLFLTRNMFGNKTVPGHQAMIGYVIDAKELGEVIRVRHSCLQPIAQQFLNEISEKLQLKTAPERNELDVVHWSIKQADLLHILQLGQ